MTSLLKQLISVSIGMLQVNTNSVRQLYPTTTGGLAPDPHYGLALVIVLAFQLFLIYDCSSDTETHGQIYYECFMILSV